MLQFHKIFGSMKITARLFGILAFLVGLFVMPLSAAAASNTLSPVSYTTTSGTSGGQPVANLAVQDQSGTANDWNKYVEFGGTYAGYRTYTVPTSITPSSITAIQVKANYQGPAKSTQTWTWKIYNWSTSAWVTLGDNTGAPDWGAWMLFTFNATGAMSDYVSGASQIQIQLVSNNSADAMDLDYEAVVITSGAGGPTNTPTLTPTVTNTPVGPTNTPTRTSTRTNTPAGPTNTPTRTSTRTNTPAGPTNTPTRTPTRTNTPVGPTNTPTRTPTATATVAAGSWWKPAVHTAWHWQLDDPVDFNNIHPVAMYDIDLFNTPAADVAHLHSLGIKVACYFSAGSYEDGRPDSGQFTAADKGNKMQGWPEYWIDTRSANVRNIMSARIQLCHDKGFDAVEPDNVDAYDGNNPGFPLTYATQLDYNRFLATTSHNLGLAVWLKNDPNQAVDLWQDFDAELNEECFHFGNECGPFYTYFVQNNKPVFHVEYGGDGESFPGFCSTTADQDHFNSIWKPGTTVDTTYSPCPYNGW